MKKNPSKKRKVEVTAAPEKKLSGLDAAHKVLASAKEPMSAKDIVERMLANGLWATAGKTPHATIYAAMLREVQSKGDASRFRKAERGRFRAA